MLFGSNKKLSWQQRLGRKYKYKYFSREYKYKYLKSVFKYSSSTRKVPSRTFCLERPQSKQYLFRQRTHSWFFTVFTVHVDLRRIAADVSKKLPRSVDVQLSCKSLFSKFSANILHRNNRLHTNMHNIVHACV